MIGTQHSWRTDASVHSVTGLRKSNGSPLLAGALFHGRRSAIAMAEPEDAQLTGMTRSLARRLLALNLKPVASSPYAAPAPVLKVA